MTASAQNAAAVPAKTSQSVAQPIPFRPEGRGPEGNAGDVLLVLVLLLGSCVALLWFARKKGWLDRWIVAPKVHALTAGLRLEQALRLSQKSTLYRVCDGDARYLILESSGGARFVKLGASHGQGADE